MPYLASHPSTPRPLHHPPQLNLPKADADAGSEGQRWQDEKGSYLEVKDGKLTLGKWVSLGEYDSAGDLRFVIQQWKMER